MGLMGCKNINLMKLALIAITKLKFILLNALIWRHLSFDV